MLPASAVSGIVPPVITPLLNGQLDVKGLERVLDRLIGGGIHALFTLGTTGEAFMLSQKTQRDVLKHTSKIVAGRIPILSGVMDCNTDRSIELAAYAASVGVDAIVITPPLCLPVSQKTLIEYVDEMLARQPLPIFLYHNPALARTSFEPQTVAELSQRPRILGFKDSSGDIRYFRQVADLIKRKDFSLLIGAEGLLPDAIAAGGHGCVGGGAHVCPRMFVQLYDALVAGNHAEVSRLYVQLKLLGRMYGDAPTATIIIRRIKCALDQMGICRDEMADPLSECDGAERQMVVDHLHELGPWAEMPHATLA